MEPPKHVKSRTPICVMLRYMAPPKIGGIQVKSVWRRGFVCPVKIIHKNEVEALPLNCEGVFFAFVGITRHPGITQEPHVMGCLYYSEVKTESEVPIQVNMKKEKKKYIYMLLPWPGLLCKSDFVAYWFLSKLSSRRNLYVCVLGLKIVFAVKYFGSYWSLFSFRM